MDNGFPILDAFNDDQAFERHFGSLLDDASNQLPVSIGEIIEERLKTWILHENLKYVLKGEAILVLKFLEMNG